MASSTIAAFLTCLTRSTPSRDFVRRERSIARAGNVRGLGRDGLLGFEFREEGRWRHRV